MDINPEIAKPVAVTTAAAIGAALGELWRSRDQPVRWRRVLISSALCAFIGYHVMDVLVGLGWDDRTVGAVVALSSLLGVEFLLFLIEKLILKRFGISHEQRIAKSLIQAGWTPPASISTMDTLQPEPKFEAGENPAL